MKGNLEIGLLYGGFVRPEKIAVLLFIILHFLLQFNSIQISYYQNSILLLKCYYSEYGWSTNLGPNFTEPPKLAPSPNRPWGRGGFASRTPTRSRTRAAPLPLTPPPGAALPAAAPQRGRRRRGQPAGDGGPGGAPRRGGPPAAGPGGRAAAEPEWSADQCWGLNGV